MATALLDIDQHKGTVAHKKVLGDYGDNVETERPIGDDIPPTYTTPETTTMITEARTEPSLKNQVNATKAGSGGELP